MHNVNDFTKEKFYFLYECFWSGILNYRGKMLLIANLIYHINSSYAIPDNLNSLWPKQTFCHPQILSLKSGITSISLAVKCSATYHKDSFLWYLRCLWLWECRNSFRNQWINGTKTIETTNGIEFSNAQIFPTDALYSNLCSGIFYSLCSK